MPIYSEAAQKAYDAWTYSTLLKAEHVDECRSGCTDLMMQCPTGMLLAEEERSAWRTFHGIRQAAEVQVA